MDGPLPGPVLVVGASHQGEVVVDLLRSLPTPPAIHGILDASDGVIDGGVNGGIGNGESFVGRLVGGITVVDSMRSLADYRNIVVGAVPAVGDCAEREAIAAALEREGIPMLAAVHPGAHRAGEVVIDPGAVVLAGAVLGVGCRVGRAAIVNSGAVIEHHTRIGDYVHVAPGACLAGNVRVGERAWVGLGAVIMENVIIGADAVVGAGAVVTRDVAPGVTVVGVPARPMTDRERSHPEKDLV